MTTPFNELLNQYRSAARSQREKGTYFERLTKIWLEHAPTQAGRYARVLVYLRTLSTIASTANTW